MCSANLLNCHHSSRILLLNTELLALYDGMKHAKLTHWQYVTYLQGLSFDPLCKIDSITVTLTVSCQWHCMIISNKIKQNYLGGTHSKSTEYHLLWIRIKSASSTNNVRMSTRHSIINIFMYREAQHQQYLIIYNINSSTHTWDLMSSH